MNTITFNQVTLNPVTQPDNQIWVTSAQLANALGYARPDSVNKIFERNSDEFTDQMSRYVNLTYRNKNNELDNNNFRIFSLRGCYAIAFFAKTEVAKQFRKWVLDLIEQQMQNSQYHQVSVMQQYCTMQVHKSREELDASQCGKGLSQWKQRKKWYAQELPKLEQQLQPLLANLDLPDTNEVMPYVH